MLGGVGVHAERSRDLLDIAAFVMAQNKCGTLHFAEPLQRGLEVGRDLGAASKPFRRRLGRRNAIEPMLRFVFGFERLMFAAALFCANEIERAVRADAIQPGAKGRAAIEPMKLFEGAKKCLLHQVFSVLFVASHAKGETEDRVTVPLYQDTKGMLVAFARLVGGCLVRPLHPAGI